MRGGGVTGREEPVGAILPASRDLAALDALLREVGGLRATLEADLTLVAGAVEEGAGELAGALLSADRAEVAAFEQRALRHLRALPACRVTAAPVGEHPRRRRRRPRARLLPAAPLLAAVVALVGMLGLLPRTPGGAARPVEPSGTEQAARTSWAALSRLAHSREDPLAVERAARDLNAQVAAMLAQPDHDPATARRALMMLQGAQALLASGDRSPGLLEVLEQSRELTRRVLASLPPVPGPARTARPTAPARPVPQVAARPSAAPARGAVSRPSTSPSVQPSDPSPSPTATTGPATPSDRLPTSVRLPATDATRG